MSNTSIQLKKSGSTGNTPSHLNLGEVAINYADGKLYYKNAIGDVTYITNQDSFNNITVNGSMVLATTPTDILTLAPNTGISILANTTTKTIDISVREDQLSSFVKKTGDTMTGDLNISTANVDANYLIVETTLFSGLATRLATPLPNLIAQFTSNSVTYVQVNAQNIDGDGSADFVITADVGSDTDYYIDMGMGGGTYNYYEGQDSPLGPLTGYLLVQGSTIGQEGGNMVVGTTSPEGNIRFIVGGTENSNVVLSLDKTVINVHTDLHVQGSISGQTITSMQDYTQSAFDKANSAYAYVTSIPSGPQGSVGAQGATGAQGDIGVQGYQGVQGVIGSLHLGASR